MFLIGSERFLKVLRRFFCSGVSEAFFIDYERFRNVSEGLDLFSDNLRCHEQF